MKRLLLSAVTVLSTAAMVAGATGAYFTSTATSSSNTFSSGTMTLVLTDSNQTEQVNISDSWEGLNLAPGQVIPEQEIALENNGTVNGTYLTVQFSYSGSPALADSIILTGNDALRFGPAKSGRSANLIEVLTGGSDNDYTVRLLDGNIPWAPGTEVSLKDLADLGQPIRIVPNEENAPLIAAGEEANFWINSMVSEALTAQGQTVNATMTFTLHQGPVPTP